MSQNVLEVKNLKAYYLINEGDEKKAVKAVDDVTFNIAQNEIVGIAGESGCGKTTLIKTLMGLLKPPLEIVGGEVDYYLNGTEIDISHIQDEKIRRGIRGSAISYVPQASMSVLNPVRRIEKSFHDFVMAHREMTKKEVDELARDHLGYLGLPPQVLKAYPHQLSGGMQQRVTIALATILKPQLVLADEPTTALDVVMQRSVIQLLKKIKNELGNTFIMITHDMAIHANFCDRIAIMYAGKLVEIATTEEIFYNSLHPYTGFLIGSLPKVGDKTEKISAPGAPPSLLDPPEGCRFHPRCPKATERCKREEPVMKDYGKGHRAACHLIEAQGVEGGR